MHFLTNTPTTPETLELVSLIQKQTESLIQNPDSALGDLYATLDSITYHFNQESQHCTFTLCFDLHNAYNTILRETENQNESQLQHDLDLLAKESHTDLHSLLNYALDIPFAKSNHILTPTTFIFTYTFQL